MTLNISHRLQKKNNNNYRRFGLKRKKGTVNQKMAFPAACCFSFCRVGLWRIRRVDWFIYIIPSFLPVISLSLFFPIQVKWKELGLFIVKYKPGQYFVDNKSWQGVSAFFSFFLSSLFNSFWPMYASYMNRSFF
jgi:hypothetical protein